MVIPSTYPWLTISQSIIRSRVHEPWVLHSSAQAQPPRAFNKCFQPVRCKHGGCKRRELARPRSVCTCVSRKLFHYLIPFITIYSDQEVSRFFFHCRARSTVSLSRSRTRTWVTYWRPSFAWCQNFLRADCTSIFFTCARNFRRTLDRTTETTSDRFVLSTRLSYIAGHWRIAEGHVLRLFGSVLHVLCSRLQAWVARK
jgi:hypothetical protein